MPTLEDVARRAGVSTATVSKVLSNTPYFTEQTRAKVLQAVEELGYIPHLAARALSSGKTHIIGVVFPYVYDAIFADPMVLNILQGVEAECSQRGHNMLLSTPRLTAAGADENYLRLIHSGYLDGVIALDNYPVASVLEPAHKEGIPCVAIGYHPTPYHVRSDDRSGGFQLMQHVVSLGHRRVGIIAVPPENHLCVPERLAGLRAAAEAAGLDFDAMPLAYGDWSTPGGARCAAELLARRPDLSAVICLNDRMAMGAIQRAREMGRRVPATLTVAGYDDIPMASVFAPPLTTISQQGPELGSRAARMLFDVLDGRQPEPVIMPTLLIARQSSAPPA
ncbi:MAG: LacI family DNA-binding transcriptional regulator [Anaerolineae bacterium]|nr:LacI family DNA-binding transcriptional regulator [Anaerolineae bacterium]